MRELGVEGLYYGGYGYATFHFAAALKALDWDPPRVMGTAFMFYSNSNEWAEGLEGWHGVDQLGEDGANPNYNAMIERFEKRFGRKTANVVVALAYDTARVAIHGIANAAIPAPKYVKEGHGEDPLDAGHQRRTRAATSSSVRGTARATRATSSPSASCAAVSSASTATTVPSGPRTPGRARRVGGVANDKVYIHEFIDIIGHNRARYMHHMTANWCPVAREERNQLCLGVWGTVGSTGRWPEVVNMWELDGWDGLVGNFAHEFAHATPQDPSLAEWWAVAASLRRGGVDRIVVPEPWTRPVDDAHRRRRARRASTPTSWSPSRPARRGEFLDALHERRRSPAHAELGLERGRRLSGWPWSTTPRHRDLGDPRLGDVGGGRAGLGRAATVRSARARGGPPRSTSVPTGSRSLLVDSPLSPLRIGRQPEVADRIPLDQIP